MASLVHQYRANPSDAYASKWLARLRHIKRIRTRVRPNLIFLLLFRLTVDLKLTHFVPPLLQAQEDIQSRSTPGISLTQGHAQQNKSFQQNTPTPNPEASGQRKRLVSTVDDFTDFV